MLECRRGAFFGEASQSHNKVKVLFGPLRDTDHAGLRAGSAAGGGGGAGGGGAQAGGGDAGEDDETESGASRRKKVSDAREGRL